MTRSPEAVGAPEGSRVRLRPVAEEDLDHLERMLADPEAIGEFNWAGFRDPRFWRTGWQENRLLGAPRWTLMVETLDGERVGFVNWRLTNPGSAFECVEFGLALWPQWRGQGLGTEAQRLLVNYLFAHTTQNRVQAGTSIDNIAEQRALERAGFTREGVLRGAAFRNGAWHDEVIYGMVRSDLR
ncbi:MAG TPA: GNAT family protein [Actinophytocola sp.]|uniref:GNAT family N-acetyltransferase n=1 Tax=Actinophytocola sp. TaxID=1872138 RepID=UPI002DB76869|nr:GNAT family protein [Actinophytocola sp.]HEU5474506.1 GNAT family protein [Actinophytocola sp.]